MPTEKNRLRSALFWGAFRVVALTIAVALIGFAVSLFLSIAGVLLVSMFHLGEVNMAQTYRTVALPVALVVLAITFALTLAIEIRNFRRTRA